jgi:hypothetical protein
VSHGISDSRARFGRTAAGHSLDSHASTASAEMRSSPGLTHALRWGVYMFQVPSGICFPRSRLAMENLVTKSSTTVENERTRDQETIRQPRTGIKEPS